MRPVHSNRPGWNQRTQCQPSRRCGSEQCAVKASPLDSRVSPLSHRRGGSAISCSDHTTAMRNTMNKSLMSISRFERVGYVARTAMLSAAALTLLACTSMGTGSGTIEPGDRPMTFSWRSTDGGISGTMSAAIGVIPTGDANADAFSGPFLQVTSSVRTDSFEPMWHGWQRGWNDWGYWGTYPESSFSTHYSGKVIANLTGPTGQLLRCRFHLNSPVAGMGGGGQGECQFNGGRTVTAVFPRS